MLRLTEVVIVFRKTLIELSLLPVPAFSTAISGRLIAAEVATATAIGIDQPSRL